MTKTLTNQHRSLVAAWVLPALSLVAVAGTALPSSALPPPASSRPSTPGSPTLAPASTPTPSSLSPTPLAPAQLQAAAERRAVTEQFFDLLFNQQYQPASTYITPVLKAEFTPEALKRKVENFEQGMGKFVKRGSAKVVDEVVLIDIQFARRTVTFVVSFDDNLKIVNANPVIGFIENQPSSPKQ